MIDKGQDMDGLRQTAEYFQRLIGRLADHIESIERSYLGGPTVAGAEITSLARKAAALRLNAQLDKSRMTGVLQDSIERDRAVQP